MKEKKEVKVVGLGFAEALALLFVGLKLCGAISWSWLWVLSPIWLPIVLAIAIALVLAVIDSK